MGASKDSCPKSYDIEPTCFEVIPAVAINHAKSICEQMGMPSSSIRVATGLMIPNAKNPSKILYGLRDPQFHTEYKDTWGLPSAGMSQDEFLNLDTDPNSIQVVMKKLAQNKLNGVELTPDKFVGWTGRLRSPNVDPQFTEPYYLIMVDLITKPVDPSNIPMSTPAYSSLLWLTPQEHAEIVTASPKKACGACSQLAFAATNQGRL